MKETFVCSHCGEEHPIAERMVFSGQELCQNCFETETCVCDRCGDRIWATENYGDSNVTLCQDCEERYYEHCAECGCLVNINHLHYLDDEDDSDDGYCETCYDRLTSAAGVHNYSYKPEPIFCGDGTRYLGVELEIDGGGENGRNASRIQEAANTFQEHIYIKHDGSLNDGLEIVTHPMTLDYHRYDMPWRDVLQKARSLYYVSHQAKTCGLHVHVNRSSLGEFRADQDAVIAHILFLVENFWNELLRFSRRTQQQMDKWASRYGRKDDPKDVLHTAKCRGDRYTCVNLTPRYTIEFRMFRGTLKYNTLIATLQMVERLCDVAFSLSDEEAKALTWSTFVADIQEDQMPELIQYLKERRLYVNEPIEGEVEV